jgi:hypothetical protein
MASLVEEAMALATRGEEILPAGVLLKSRKLKKWYFKTLR